jgi:hypothetical protein
MSTETAGQIVVTQEPDEKKPEDVASDQEEAQDDAEQPAGTDGTDVKAKKKKKKPKKKSNSILYPHIAMRFWFLIDLTLF